MQETKDDLVQGRTRWRRFAVAMVPTTALAGAIVFGMANGTIAASFAVSGQTFKVSASKLVGEGFVQYGGLAFEKGADPHNPLDPKNHPVAVSGIKHAELYDLCQSVKVPGLPVVMTINAGADNKPATADDLLIDMEELSGDAVFTRINIGQDASTLTAGPSGALGAPGSFGQQADRVVITNLEQVARSTSAGTFKLTGLKLKVNVGAAAQECF